MKQTWSAGASGAQVRTVIDDNFTEVYNTLENTSEIAITEAVTLDATAWGKWHIVSGVSATYTVTLPTAVGHTKSIGFKFSHELTKVVTLDGNAAETIEGKTTINGYTGRSVVLVSDGTNLRIVHDTAKVTSVAIYAGGETLLVLTDQPNTEQSLKNSGGAFIPFDASVYHQVRLCARVAVASASPNSPRLYPSYSLDGGGSWTNLGDATVASGDALSLASTGQKATNWLSLPLEARADVLFRCTQNGGNGVADPSLVGIHLNFR